jgi:hypothetical protein
MPQDRKGRRRKTAPVFDRSEQSFFHRDPGLLRELLDASSLQRSVEKICTGLLLQTRCKPKLRTCLQQLPRRRWLVYTFTAPMNHERCIFGTFLYSDFSTLTNFWYIFIGVADELLVHYRGGVGKSAKRRVGGGT